MHGNLIRFSVSSSRAWVLAWRALSSSELGRTAKPPRDLRSSQQSARAGEKKPVLRQPAWRDPPTKASAARGGEAGVRRSDLGGDSTWLPAAASNGLDMVKAVTDRLSMANGCEKKLREAAHGAPPGPLAQRWMRSLDRGDEVRTPPHRAGPRLRRASG